MGGWVGWDGLRWIEVRKEGLFFETSSDGFISYCFLDADIDLSSEIKVERVYIG